MYLRLPTTFAVIFGSFTLGLYTAIQGPTLMDLIDLLHVNNDIMSYSLAFASLAYSVGGLLSGFLFNYVNRQLLISAYFLIFGISNIATPFISNYLIFSVITVFKMMCAAGTDCGANVWILEMWPGQDSWLQALHFSFATGCALGPLIVEPFLSVEAKETEIDKMAGKTSGTASINDQNSETRIHIPYGASGLASIMAGVFILTLYFLQEKEKRRLAMLKAKQQAAAGEGILLSSIKHPAALEAGDLPPPAETGSTLRNRASCCQHANEPASVQEREPLQELELVVGGEIGGGGGGGSASKQVDENALTKSAIFLPKIQQEASSAADQQQQQQLLSVQIVPSGKATPSPQLEVVAATTGIGTGAENRVKITSKCKEQLVGRPPYYVMFAIALSAMCLSFYCGIEITSMNYLATFAVNIDLQLNKSTAALMSSALTISFAVGRAFGIWIAAYMKPHKLFYLCSAIMAVGNVFMLIFANTAETLLWYSICLFGIGCGPMFPAIVSFYDDKISKVTNTVSGIFILGSMFNVALNSLIIGHHIIDNALILIVCNLVGSVILLLLFGTLHMLTKVKKNQRVKKFNLKQQGAVAAAADSAAAAIMQQQQEQEQQVALLQQQQQQQQQNQHQSTDDLRQPPTTNDNNSNSNNNNNNSSSINNSSSNSNSNNNNNNNNNSSSSNTKGIDEDDHHHHVETTPQETAATTTTSAKPIDQ